MGWEKKKDDKTKMVIKIKIIMKKRASKIPKSYDST
jgi:hypothetical protein